jgi:hypothetical protein
VPSSVQIAEVTTGSNNMKLRQNQTLGKFEVYVYPILSLRDSVDLVHTDGLWGGLSVL